MIPYRASGFQWHKPQTHVVSDSDVVLAQDEIAIREEERQRMSKDTMRKE
jgi:hypothetical protein